MRRLNKSNMIRCLITNVLDKNIRGKGYFVEHVNWLRVFVKMGFE